MTSTRTDPAAFLDVVCEDADLLRAEFDGIIAVSYGPRRATPPRPVHLAADRPATVRQPRPGPVRPWASLVPRDAPRRERSPPGNDVEHGSPGRR